MPSATDRHSTAGAALPADFPPITEAEARTEFRQAALQLYDVELRLRVLATRLERVAPPIEKMREMYEGRVPFSWLAFAHREAVTAHEEQPTIQSLEEAATITEAVLRQRFDETTARRGVTR